MVQASEKAASAQSAYFLFLVAYCNPIAHNCVRPTMPDRVARAIYAGSVLFASLLWAACAIGSLLRLALGDSLDRPLIAMLASFGLLVAAIGRAICLALA